MDSPPQLSPHKSTRSPSRSPRKPQSSPLKQVLVREARRAERRQSTPQSPHSKSGASNPASPSPLPYQLRSPRKPTPSPSPSKPQSRAAFDAAFGASDLHLTPARAQTRHFRSWERQPRAKTGTGNGRSARAKTIWKRPLAQRRSPNGEAPSVNARVWNGDSKESDEEEVIVLGSQDEPVIVLGDGHGGSEGGETPKKAVKKVRVESETPVKEHTVEGGASPHLWRGKVKARIVGREEQRGNLPHKQRARDAAEVVEVADERAVGEEPPEQFGESDDDESVALGVKTLEADAEGAVSEGQEHSATHTADAEARVDDADQAQAQHTDDEAVDDMLAVIETDLASNHNQDDADMNAESMPHEGEANATAAAAPPVHQSVIDPIADSALIDAEASPERPAESEVSVSGSRSRTNELQDDDLPQPRQATATEMASAALEDEIVQMPEEQQPDQETIMLSDGSDRVQDELVLQGAATHDEQEGEVEGHDVRLNDDELGPSVQDAATTHKKAASHEEITLGEEQPEAGRGVDYDGNCIVMSDTVADKRDIPLETSNISDNEDEANESFSPVHLSGTPTTVESQGDEPESANESPSSSDEIDDTIDDTATLKPSQVLNDTGTIEPPPPLPSSSPPVTHRTTSHDRQPLSPRSPEQSVTNIEDVSASPTQTTTLPLNDDETLLHDFLARTKASKAARIANQEHASHKRDSDVVKHALSSRAPLDELSAYGSSLGTIASPSKFKQSDVTGGSSASPTLMLDFKPPSIPEPSGVDSQDSTSGSPLRPRRRSRLSAKSYVETKIETEVGEDDPVRPRRISVRSQTPHKDFVIKKTEAQELAQKTRANTRKNKGGAVPVRAVLTKMKNVVDDGIILENDARMVEGRKGVRWNEDLVSFFETNQENAHFQSLETVTAADGAQLKTRSQNKRKKALGAINGTPAKAKSREPKPDGSAAEAKSRPDAKDDSASERASAEVQVPDVEPSIERSEIDGVDKDRGKKRGGRAPALADHDGKVDDKQRPTKARKLPVLRGSREGVAEPEANHSFSAAVAADPVQVSQPQVKRRSGLPQRSRDVRRRGK